MPRKATPKVVEEKVADSQAESHSEPVPEKKRRGAKTRVAPEVSTPVAPEVVEAPSKKGRKPKAPVDSTPVESVAEPTPKTRQLPNRESVEKEFADLVSSIEEEIGKLRDSTGKTKGVKFLRTLNKRVKILRNHALRASKQRSSVRRKNTNSGFLKPVQISKELATFTGWNPDEPRSRVDVTKYICEYVKKHDLQNPKDRRQIRAEDDSKLKKLLGYDGSGDKPLTYYSLQTYLKNHFTPVAPTATVVAEPEVATVEPPAKKGGKRRA